MSKTRLTKRQRKKLAKTLAALEPVASESARHPAKPAPELITDELRARIRKEVYKKFPMLKGFGIVD